jgi:radical SAM superfamily enzyme YgiQ (UPF0313 family)
MKICFIQKEAFPYFGIISLAGYLKDKGVESNVLIANLEKDLNSKLKKISPDLIGISVLTTEHSWLVEMSQQVKSAFPDIPIIVGGVHTILYPKVVLQIPDIDYVCTGEGELTLANLCESTKKGGTDIRNIKGIGYRNGKDMIINEREVFLGNLSTHFDDREIYYRQYPIFRDDELKQFIASRGCPYKCAFCFNEQLKAIFKSKGKYVRMKDPEHFIKEIQLVKESAVMKSIYFADDLFTMYKSWLKRFLPLYKEKINIPYMCTTRADLMDEEIARLLIDSGCHTVSFGIETGNERIRTEILQKQITNEEIINCGNVLKKNGIRIQTSNMFCLPGETLDDAFDTVRININIKSDFTYSTLFMPFPDTKLAKYCIENGYLKEGFSFKDLPKSFLTHSILILQDKVKIENVQKVSHFLIRYPFLYAPAEKLIRNFNFNGLYYALLFLGTFLRYKKERQISFYNAIKFLWRFRKSY